MNKIKTSKYNIIIITLIMNFFINFTEIKDKTRFYHLLVMVFGFITPTRLKSCREISNSILGSPDGSNLSDSLRLYPQFYKEILQTARDNNLKWILKQAKPMTPIYLSVDDSFLTKSKKQKSFDMAYYNSYKGETGIQIVFMHIQVGKYHTVFGYKIYNPKNEISKLQLVMELVDEIKDYFKGFNNVTFLTDSWYAEEKLIKYVINDLKWSWISAIKSNRLLNGKSVQNRFHFVANKSYQDIELNKNKYKIFGQKGKLNNFEDEGLFIASKKKQKNGYMSWRYYYSSNPKITVQQALYMYNHRWSIENDFWTLKEQLGIEDFRVQKESSLNSFLNIELLSYLWLYHIRNLEVKRIRGKELTNSVCKVLLKIRKATNIHFDFYGKDGIKILLEEFMKERLHNVRPE